MNILKESLFASSTSDPAAPVKTKPRRTGHARTGKLAHGGGGGDDHSFEPLLSPSELQNNSIELGTFESDDDDNGGAQGKMHAQHIIRSRHTKQPLTPAAHGGGSIVIVEKPIRANETLQAFAIRYRVPVSLLELHRSRGFLGFVQVSQLKRLNNLQNDQDFYALKYCRVPVRRFGLLHEPSSSTPSTIVDFTEQPTANTTSPSQLNHHAFLNAMDHDLASMRAKVEQLIETPPAALIPDQPTSTMMIRTTGKPRSDFTCDGADCGCKLWHILGALLLIALLVPLVYVYIYVTSPPTKIEHFP